jgi:hypothetical protein
VATRLAPLRHTATSVFLPPPSAPESLAPNGRVSRRTVLWLVVVREVRPDVLISFGCMADVTESLILDLLEWVANNERTYDEVMDAWRTSCPRLSIWEDANDLGLITTEDANGCCIVRVTQSGFAFLRRKRPTSPISDVLAVSVDALSGE